MTQFKDRCDSGKKLAEKLSDYKDTKKLLVIGLPTSMVTAYEVAQQLNAFLDICVPKLVHAPQKPDLIIGAVTSDSRVIDEQSLAKTGIAPNEVSTHFWRYQGDAKTYEKKYRGACKKRNPTNNVVIVVDDGNADPLMIRAVLNSIRAQNPEKLILACPVITTAMFEACSHACDDIVCCDTVDDLDELYACYESFKPDEETQVHALLEKCQKK